MKGNRTPIALMITSYHIHFLRAMISKFSEKNNVFHMKYILSKGDKALLKNASLMFRMRLR